MRPGTGGRGPLVPDFAWLARTVRKKNAVDVLTAFFVFLRKYAMKYRGE